MGERIFIGSSSESLNIAQLVQLELSKRRKDYNTKIWNQQVIKASQYTIPELIRVLPTYDYAIFIFSDDDEIKSRGKKNLVARDNVVFEFGLATSILGLEKCFVFKSKNVTLPTDFGGLTIIHFESIRDKSGEYNDSKIGAAVSELEMSIEAVSRLHKEKTLSWDSYCNSVACICKKLARSPRRGGFRFDAILGITRGGIIAADMINRKFLASSPLFCLCPDYTTKQPEISFDSSRASVNQHVLEALKQYSSILVVDDITRSGKTIFAALEYVKKRFPDKTIKGAVVYVPEKYRDTIDYYGEVLTNASLSMPYSVFD